MATKTDDGLTVDTDMGRLSVLVVGGRPENEPYIWLGYADGTYVDSIGEDEARSLRDALSVALGEVAPTS